MKRILRWFRYVRNLEKENRRLKEAAEVWQRFRPPGHFYSPLSSLEEIEKAFTRGDLGPPFEGIDLREAEQREMLEEIIAHYHHLPFPQKKTQGWRYWLDNISYGTVDGIMLHGMIRHAQPKRIIEVGSGFSSAAILDMNEHLFDGQMQLTFIDPDMTSLRRLVRAGEWVSAERIEKEVQEVPLDVFEQLEANDILFIDSSHISKVGSDVNHLFFRVLPVLRPGVYVHIHDIAWDLEYPREWLEEGRAWNEQYFLRAFLMYNRAFEIVFFAPWMLHRHREYLLKKMPRCACGGGGQMWLRRTEG